MGFKTIKSEGNLKVKAESNSNRKGLRKTSSAEDIKEMSETMFSQWLVVCSRDTKLKRREGRAVNPS